MYCTYHKLASYYVATATASYICDIPAQGKISTQSWQFTDFAMYQDLWFISNFLVNSQYPTPSELSQDFLWSILGEILVFSRKFLWDISSWKGKKAFDTNSWCIFQTLALFSNSLSFPKPPRLYSILKISGPIKCLMLS